MAGADAAGVLAETHVAPIVVAVLDLPVAAVPGEQPFGVRPVLWNGGDAESGLFTGFAGFQVGALAGDAEHLLMSKASVRGGSVCTSMRRASMRP